MQEIIVGGDETPKRVENLLKRQFPIGYVRKLFRKNGVRINGRRAKAEDLIRPADRIQIFIPFEAKTNPREWARAADKFEVVFENDLILVLDKAPGLAVHEGKTVARKNSLLGILQARYSPQGITPRLVHRLDKDTSGLLVVAKNPEIAAHCERSFETGEVGKEYLALVIGRLSPNDGKIDSPLPGRESMSVRAVTRYRVVQRFSEATLLRITLETGRLHQIRLHFAQHGHPVIMDEQHGDFGFNKRFRKKYGLKRQFLHAEKLSLKIAGKPYQWTAPLAEDLELVLRKLTAEGPRLPRRPE